MTLGLFSKACVPFTIVVVGFFASASVKPQKQGDVADANVRRLQPSAFAQLPAQILRYLEAHQCTIPQHPLPSVA